MINLDGIVEYKFISHNGHYYYLKHIKYFDYENQICSNKMDFCAFFSKDLLPKLNIIDSLKINSLLTYKYRNNLLYSKHYAKPSVSLNPLHIGGDIYRFKKIPQDSIILIAFNIKGYGILVTDSNKINEYNNNSWLNCSYENDEDRFDDWSSPIIMLVYFSKTTALSRKEANWLGLKKIHFQQGFARHWCE
jgi:hypothetical protein